MQKKMALTAKALVVALSVVTLFFGVSTAANMKAPPPEVAADIVIVGDRVVDIAFHLGVLPKAMSVRGGLWPMAKKLKTTTQILGCPNCIVNKPETVPNAIKKFGIKRLIIEKSNPYCLYKKNVKPENVVPLVKETGVTIEYVDFSQGLESAIQQTAKLLGRTDKAAKVIARYTKQVKAAESKLPKKPTPKKVLVFNGTFQAATGKVMLRVEAPGGYSDQFLLSRLGGENVGDAFKPANGKSQKGHYPVRKTKNGLDLSPLLQAAPDIIVMVGDVYAVQKTLATALAQNPKFKEIPALKNLAMYALPVYVDSGVLEYPKVLKKWTNAFNN